MKGTMRLLALLILGGLTLVPAGHAAPAPDAALLEAPSRRATEPAPTDWPLPRGNAARTGATVGPGVAAAPAVAWRFEPRDRSLLTGSPVAAAGTVFVASDEGVLNALDATTGAERWHVSGFVVDDYDRDVSLAVGDDLIYVAGYDRPTSDDNDRLPAVLRALDVNTGEERWHLVLGSDWRLGQPTFTGDVLYIAAAGDRKEELLLALDAATGTERWRQETYGSDLAVAGGALYFKTFRQQEAFVSLDATTGAPRWQIVPEGIWQSTSPVVAEGLVYVVAREEDRSRILLSAFDAVTGDVRWRNPVECCTYGGLAVASGIVYVASGLDAGNRYPDDVLLALDANTGEERWRAEGIGGAPVVAGDLVYGIAFPAGSVPHRPFEHVTVVALDAATGMERWRLDEVGADVIAAGDMIFAMHTIGLSAIVSSPEPGAPTIVTPVVPPGETLRTGPATRAARDDGSFELVLTSLNCPEWAGQPGVATEFRADSPPADLEADGCRRAAAGDILFTLFSLGPDSRSPIELAHGFSDEQGEVRLRGTLPPDAGPYQIDAQPLHWAGTPARSEPLPSLAAAYTVVHHDEWEPSSFTIRVLTCPIDIADPVAACRDNRVDRRVYDDFDIRPASGGGFSEADPGFIDVESRVGPVTVAALPSVISQYLGAYVSCLDGARNEVVFAGEASDGRASFELAAGGMTACEWYYLTPAGGAALVTPVPPPAPSTPVLVDAPGLYVAVADGSEHINLTEDEPSVALPAWSPDGRRIAYLAKKRRHHVLSVVNADGSERRQLSSLRLAAVPPSWSPDGRQIAVETVDGMIYAVAADGFGAAKLTETGSQTPPAEGYAEFVGWPAWSPTGDAIAFLAAGPDGAGTEIFLMSATGTNVRPLTALSGELQAAFPTWSPNGEHIAFFLMRVDTGVCVTAVVNTDGTGLRLLDPCGRVAWSPDSSELLIEIYLGDGGSQIDRAHSDGSGAVTITGQGVFSLPAWSADGRLIAYLDDWTWDNGACIALVKAEGSEPVCLATVVGASTVGWIGWSPAGNALAFQVPE